MGNLRFGSFDSDLRKRHAVTLFDEEILDNGRFDRDLLQSDLLTAASVGFSDPDRYGVARIADVIKATALVDADSFGAATSQERTAAAGLANVTAFGAEVGKLNIKATGLLDTDAFGAVRIRVTLAEIGFVDPDAFGALTGKDGLNAAGFLDPDLFGVGRIRDILYATGLLDSDAFGVLYIRPSLRPAGFFDPDFFGAAVAKEILYEHGFLDPDYFGLSFAPQKSPRRTSRRRPMVGSVARPRVTKAGGTVKQYFEVILYSEPADVQNRAGSFIQSEAGLVDHERTVIYFDLAAAVQPGYRFITSEDTFLVMNVAVKAKQIQAEVERVVTL